MEIVLAVDAILILLLIAWATIYKSVTGRELNPETTVRRIHLAASGGVIAFFLVALLLYGRN